MKSIYYFNNNDVTYMFIIKIKEIAEIIAKKENIDFPSAIMKVYSSDTYKVLCDTENGLWAESAPYIVDQFYY